MLAGSLSYFYRWEVFPFYYASRRNLLPFIDDVKLSLAAPFLGFVRISIRRDDSV